MNIEDPTEIFEAAAVAQQQLLSSRRRKLWILIPNDIPPGLAVIATAHGVLVAHAQWTNVNREYMLWMQHSGSKLVCTVTREQFYYYEKELGINCLPVTESRQDSQKLALVVCPTTEDEAAALKLDKLLLYPAGNDFWSKQEKGKGK